MTLLIFRVRAPQMAIAAAIMVALLLVGDWYLAAIKPASPRTLLLELLKVATLLGCTGHLHPSGAAGGDPTRRARTMTAGDRVLLVGCGVPWVRACAMSVSWPGAAAARSLKAERARKSIVTSRRVRRANWLA